MTEIEKKALALLDELAGFLEGPTQPTHTEYREALCRAIEQHEAFRQEVRDAAERCIDDCGHDGLRKAHIPSRLSRFIIAKPDPLVEAMADCGVDRFETWADQLRAAIKKRGGKIVWGEG